MNERTGDYCPQCGSTEIEGEGVEIGRDTATQEVGCNTCCAEWYDDYQLTGYRLIEPGNNLSFDADELRVIDTALRHAIQDVEDYIKSGDADRDFTDPQELAEYKQLPDQWLELRKRILQHQVGQV